MYNKEDDDNEIFYDAYERISECQKNSGKDLIKEVKQENVFSRALSDTIYHEAIDSKEKENFNANTETNSNKEIDKINQNNLDHNNILQNNHKENLLFNDIKKIFNSQPNRSKQESEDKKNNNTIAISKKESMQEDMRNIDIDIEYLKKNMRLILTKAKGIKDKHFQNLFELQCFQGDSHQILVAKISYGGKFLATGGLSGVLKIWQIYSEDDSIENYENRGVNSFLKFLNENAFRIYTAHKKEIIDISWHPKVNFILKSIYI